MELLSKHNLQSMIRCESVGQRWPYVGGSERDIEKHLKKTVAKLKRIKGVGIEAEFGHYGSGYASYVDIFCYPKDRSSQWEDDGVLRVRGVSVYLSRLAPLAVLGQTERSRLKGGSSFDFLYPEDVESFSDDDCSSFVDKVRGIVVEFGFTFMDRETAMTQLPFDADIPTILSEPPYRVFDAVFFWED